MNKLTATITALACGLTAAGKVHYLAADGGQVPEGQVAAVEVRAALPGGSIGEGKTAAWSVTWPGTKIVLRFDNRNFIDGVDEPAAIVSVGATQAKVTKGLDFDGGYNTLAIEWLPDGSAQVLAGNRELQRVLTLTDVSRPDGIVRIEGNCDVSDVIVETADNAFSRLQSDYQPEELERAAHWRYLDRENDPTVALPGGAYELAMVPTCNGYDLVYIAGAQTNATHWRPGMIKGSLEATGFQGYYKLKWNDATGRELPDECYAQIDGKVMTLTFPSLQASMRFSECAR